MKKLSIIDWIAYALLIIGGLNWLFVGLFSLDLVFAIFGDSIITTMIYVIVGISALYIAILTPSLEKKEPAESPQN